MKRSGVLIFIFFSLSLLLRAQYSTLNAHSHNDYLQKIPFFLAYDHHFGSIEADIWAVGDKLLVAHNRNEINPSLTLDSLYIQPVVKLFGKNGGKPWKDSPSTFQLLIDLKTGVEPTLSMLVEKLKKYPAVFDPAVNKNAVRVVITGNRPIPSDFGKYPSFVFFDGNLKLQYDVAQLKRVGLYSENLKVFTQWNGNTPIAAKEEARLKHVIDSVHFINKKIRLWNAPDSIPAWEKLISLKADYINTDHIADLSAFLKGRQQIR
jgi:alkaline phosphatase